MSRVVLLGALLGVCGVGAIPLPEEDAAGGGALQEDLSLDAGSGPAPPPSLKALYKDIVQSVDDVEKEAQDVVSKLEGAYNSTTPRAEHQVQKIVTDIEKAASRTGTTIEGLLSKLLNNTTGETEGLLQQLEHAASGAVSDIGKLLNDLANGSSEDVRKLLQELRNEPGLPKLESDVNQLLNNTFGDIGAILRRFNATSLIPPPPHVTVQP